MLVEVLDVGEHDAAGGAYSRYADLPVRSLAIHARAETSSSRVGCRLLDAVYRSQMSLEDVGSVETLLCWAATSGAESTDHRPLVVSQSMTILVVFSGESLDVVFT